MEVEKDSLAFTYCQIPVVYMLADKEGVRIETSDDNILEFEELTLDPVTSKKVFDRTGEINQIVVSMNK